MSQGLPQRPDLGNGLPTRPQAETNDTSKPSLEDFSWEGVQPSTGYSLNPPGNTSSSSPSPTLSEGTDWDNVDIDNDIVLPTLDADVTELDSDEERIDLNSLLETLVQQGGSDLHLTSKSKPVIRIDGSITPIEEYPVLSSTEIHDAVTSIMTDQQEIIFDDTFELDFAYSLEGNARFRVNVYKQQGSVGAVFRTIPWEIKTAEELNLPEVVNTFATLPRGLVLVTGPTGSGKSTTLAAIIDRANRTRADHIMTIEDPIEFVHTHQKSIVNQREVGRDTKSFANALKHVLRQDPDIILVGELRDLETIQIALTAAETGHLVFGTLHTQSAQETITRIVDVFPDESKAQVQTQLAASLQAVVSQSLLKRIGGGRAAAIEIMVATDAIRNQIRQGKLQTIQSTLQTGERDGQKTMDKALEELIRNGTVTWEEARLKARDPKELETKLGGPESIRALENRHARAREANNFNTTWMNNG